jgi:hypothetical protein
LGLYRKIATLYLRSYFHFPQVLNVFVCATVVVRLSRLSLKMDSIGAYQKEVSHTTELGQICHGWLGVQAHVWTFHKYSPQIEKLQI